VLFQYNNKAWITAHLLTTEVTEDLGPIVKTYLSGKIKKIPFNI
jgi:hypothetical protein